MVLGPFRCDDSTKAELERRAREADDSLTSYLIRRGLEDEHGLRAEIELLREEVAVQRTLIDFLDRALEDLADGSAGVSKRAAELLKQRKKAERLSGRKRS